MEAAIADSLFALLPSELTYAVFDFLESKEIDNVGRVCKLWNEIGMSQEREREKDESSKNKKSESNGEQLEKREQNGGV
jgi:hypothetical protein